MNNPVHDMSESFEGAGDYYPGSKRKRRAVAGVEAPESSTVEPWDTHPQMIRIDGKVTEFFQIGALGTALCRSSNTIRRWISDGTIPPASYRMNSASIKGQRRLWTRAQIEGMVRIAREEGLFDCEDPVCQDAAHDGGGAHRGRNVGGTEFTVRVRELFRVLRGQA